MDEQRFDALTRALARGSSRRTALKGLFGGLAGGAALTTRLDRAGADDGCDCVAVPCKSLSCDTGDCVYTDIICADPCTACNINTGVCDPKVCGPCQVCDAGVCDYPVSIPNGRCCGTEGNYYCAECCDDDDCPGCEFCNLDNVCEEPECCTDDDCTEGICGDCQRGSCEYHTCCYPDHPCTEPCHTCSSSGCINLCSRDEECCGEDCVAIGACCRESGDTCTVTDGPNTQGNCCEDLLCCSTGEGGACQECCHDDDCPGCSYCKLGVCTDECVEGRRCCEGDCIPDDECCAVGPECPPNHFCCGKGEAGEHCAFCCENSQCEGEFGYCDDGQCYLGQCFVDSDCPDCAHCTDHTCYGECSQSQECCDGDCVHIGTCCRHEGDICGVEPTADSPQKDCCDGLHCCYGQTYNMCAECCGDDDCDSGGACEDWVCVYPSGCDHDRDCPRDTCCCKDGTCSRKCCHHPHPHPKPQPPDQPVTSLPATGSGVEAAGNGLLGAAALGAAALLAASKLRDWQNSESNESPAVD